MDVQTVCRIEPIFDDNRFLKIRIRLLHDGNNHNTYISLDALKKAQNSIANIPILATVMLDKHGRPFSFNGHDLHSHGKHLIYDETPVGLIPETCNYCIEPWDGRNYVFVDGYMWRAYGDYAAQILERDQKVKVSMEAQHIEEKCECDGKIHVHDFLYRGVTLVSSAYQTAMHDTCAFVCK